MRYFIIFLLLSIYSFGLEYNLKPYQVTTGEKRKRVSIVQYKKTTDIEDIHYSNFKQAKQEAIRENKLLLIKIEATNCEPCHRLNHLLETNNHIKSMINQHIKAVKINTDYDSVPMGLSYLGTPTVFLIQPKNGKILMKLDGDMVVMDLEESLQLFVNSGLLVSLQEIL